MHYITEKIRILLVSVLSLFFLTCSLNSIAMDGGSSSSEGAYSSDEEFTLPDSPVHYSQSGKSETKVGRQDFNDETVINHIGQLHHEIEAFKSKPSAQNFKDLAQAIANIANKAYHSYKKEEQGPLLGTLKHTLCYDFMEKIKGENHGTAFDNVHAEHSPNKNSSKRGGSRLDLVWYDKKTNTAYILDYKFGDDNKGTSQEKREKYVEAIKNKGFKVHLTDIRPQD